MDSHILSILVENSSGVLGRVIGLISRRGFNIESLTVGETQESSVSRMTIIVPCDPAALDQIVEQLRKLICVLKVEVLPHSSAMTRELLLIKVSTSSKSRSEVLEIASIFRARVVDVSSGSLTLEITGESGKSAALIGLLSEFGILEMVRTGTASLSRGSHTIYSENDREDM